MAPCRGLVVLPGPLDAQEAEVQRAELGRLAVLCSVATCVFACHTCVSFGRASVRICLLCTLVSCSQRRGVILEVAEAKTGGAHKLQQALDRGDVHSDKNEQGITLYYFPQDSYPIAKFARCTISHTMCAVIRSLMPAVLCPGLCFVKS